MAEAKVIFTLNGDNLTIQCSKMDKMRDICQKYATKVNKNIDSLVFLYGGNQINFNLSFNEQASSLDRNNNIMRVLVDEKDNNRLICPKCGEKIKLKIEELDNIIISYNEIKDTINGIKLSIDNMIKASLNDLTNIQLKNINKVLNIINEDIKQNNKKLNNLLTEQKNIINNTNNKLDIIDNIIDKSYDNYNIKLKKPLHKLNYHTDSIYCSTVLKDGRFVTGSGDKSIIIYNNKTFKPDLTIKEHSSSVYNVIQLSSGDLASCSFDKTIKIYNINGNEYKVLQTLTYHTGGVSKIIELRNKKLVSCSGDKSIIFYFKDNNEYIKDYSISTNGENGPIIQTKDNEICYYDSGDGSICFFDLLEICYHEYTGNSVICFFDLLERKIINKINNISVTCYNVDSMLMISNDLLLITGKDKISILNVNSHSLIRTIDVSDSYSIYAAIMLNKNMILTADYNKRIIQWKIEGDNLQLISKKENAHDSYINTLSKIGNGLILSGSGDKMVKIW